MSASGENKTISSKFLTFALVNEEYGLPILTVREIIGCPPITPVPRAPSHVRGVINLRGQVIPVMDLRARFALPAGERTDKTCIIVVETRAGGRKASTGILVDRVCEVVEIPASNIEPAPDWGDETCSQYLIGLGKVGPAVKILLSVDAIVGADTNQAAAA